MRLETIAPVIYNLLGCPPWQADALRPSKIGGDHRQLHQTGHDREALAQKGARMSELLGIACGACEGIKR